MRPPRMTPADWADYRAQSDTGVTTYPMDDPPDLLDERALCPVCGGTLALGEHDTVTVLDATGEVIACLDLDGRASTLAADPESWQP